MRFPWLPYFLSDFLAITVSYYLTVLFRFRSSVGLAFYDKVTFLLLEQPAGEAGAVFESFYYGSAFRIILILTAVLCLLYALRNLYSGRRFLLPQSEVWNILLSNLIALVIFYAYWYLTRNTYHPRSLFASVIVVNIVLCSVFRSFTRMLLQMTRNKWDVDRCGTLLVGSGDTASLIEELLAAQKPHGVYCRLRLSVAPAGPFDVYLQKIRSLMREHQVDMLILADLHLDMPEIMQVLEMAAEEGIPVKVLSRHLKVVVSDADLICDLFQGIPLVHFDAPRKKGKLGRFRHVVTIFWAAILLLFVSPFMLLIAAVIRLTSPGKAIFRQKRIGINRKPFLIYKFRTMRHAAEEQLATMESENETRGALFKIRRDPRITPVGRFLRRFSLDELPQLLNVLRGDMVLVGPRPLPERDFENYEHDWHYIRHDGLPGLTCLWQISGRSNLDFYQMCILDIYYLRNHTWIMDIDIALKTLKVVLFGTGAY